MLSKVGYLWDMLTIFFSEIVFSDPLFKGLILFLSIFGTIFIFMWFFDRKNWGW